MRTLNDIETEINKNREQFKLASKVFKDEDDTPLLDYFNQMIRSAELEYYLKKQEVRDKKLKNLLND